MSGKRSSKHLLAFLLVFAMVFTGMSIPVYGYAAAEPTMVKFDVTDNEENKVTNPSIEITCPEENDDDCGDAYAKTAAVSPEAGTTDTFKMYPNNTYNYKITAPGYAEVAGSLDPSTQNWTTNEVTFPVKLNRITPEQTDADQSEELFPQKITAANIFAAATEAELLALLDKYYTADMLLDVAAGTAIDPDAVRNTILLPRYTKITDDSGNPVFNDGEITVTSSDSDLIQVNGYRANVDPFVQGKTEVKLIVSFTRGGVTVKKEIPLKVLQVTEEELDQEIALLDLAKKEFFNGIDDGQYKDPGSVKGNLHPFTGMALDAEGNPVWTQKIGAAKTSDIIPDSFFDDPWEMEEKGYNKFQSSNPEIIAHDSLLVTRPEEDTSVTISAILSSVKFGEFAGKHPENEKLQKLYKQPASTQVVVVGTKTALNALKSEIQSAKNYLDNITEGTGAGQYQAGTKAELDKAIKAAEEVVENGTEDQLEKARADLGQAIQQAELKANSVSITISANCIKDKNKNVFYEKLVVSSDDAEKYGYFKASEERNKVTVIDVLAVIHHEMFGDKFDQDPGQYLGMPDNGFITRVFGVNTFSVGYLINGEIPKTFGVVDVANTAIMENNDMLTAFIYNTANYSDLYLEFKNMPASVPQMDEFTVALQGFRPGAYPPDQMGPVSGCTIKFTNIEDPSVTYTAVTDSNGNAKAVIEKDGKYKATVDPGDSVILPPEINLTVTEVTASYEKVNEAIAAAEKLRKDHYKNFNPVTDAINAVVPDKNIMEQETVDGYADAINDAVKALVYKDADYSKADKAIADAAALDRTQYKDFSAVDRAVASVVRGKNITEQETVDAYADAINKAVQDLEKAEIKEEIKAETELPPETGDHTNLLFWMSLFMVSAISVPAVRRKMNK